MQKVANAVGDAVARKFSERGVDHLDAVASGHLDVAANCLAVLLYLRAYSYTCPVTSLRQLSRDQLSACSVRAVSYRQIFPWSPPILTLYPCSVRLSLSDIHLTPTTQVVVVGRLSVYLYHPPPRPLSRDESGTECRPTVRVRLISELLQFLFPTKQIPSA